MPNDASFNESVYDIVRRVPFGRVTTYGCIARALGHPRWSRQVGWAMWSLTDDDVPAHRVVNAEGGVRGLSADVRRAELEAEGVTFDDQGRVRLDVHLWEPD